jgi:hypothetical protein
MKINAVFWAGGWDSSSVALIIVALLASDGFSRAHPNYLTDLAIAGDSADTVSFEKPQPYPFCPPAAYSWDGQCRPA